MSTRQTIDFGIDLGTTNSAIAVRSGASAMILPSPDQDDTIPSVVAIDDLGTVQVGRKARNLIVEDPDNTCAEFKANMGRSGEDMHFKDANRTMSPPELSGEVLKELRGHVEMTEEKLTAAVVTVPAAFTADQNAATLAAAELAGLDPVVLLPEPTAAAWAYFCDMEEPPANGFWLVYDFGGGTFDAAILKVEDREFRVVNHAGDNNLGGKGIDWTLVEDVLIPQFRQAHGITISRDDKNTLGALGVLKGMAETAKIGLTVRDETRGDDFVKINGESIRFRPVITRADLDRAARPLVEASVRHCRDALASAGLAPDVIERVVLVGGSSKLRLVQKMLADPVEGLGIQLDRSQNPITVVARGAAIFAGTVLLPTPEDSAEPLPEGAAHIELDYPLSGVDDSPLVRGKVSREDVTDWSAWSVNLVNVTSKSVWDSDYVSLTADGIFRVRVLASEIARHTFSLTLFDPHRSMAETSLATFTYDHLGADGDRTTRAAHTLGVSLDDNRVEVLISKNSELPAKGRTKLRTTEAISKAAGTGRIVIPIIEGENSRADRNPCVGKLTILPGQVRRDVPAGTEIQIDLQADVNFQRFSASVYVPILDEEFKIPASHGRNLVPPLEELQAGRAVVSARYDSLSLRVRKVGATAAQAVLDQFVAAGRLTSIDRLLSQAQVNPAALAECEGRQREAMAELDRVEDLVEVPDLADKARAAVAEARHRASGTKYAAEVEEISRSLEDAIDDGDAFLIERLTQDAGDITFRVLSERGELHTTLFADIDYMLSTDPRPQVQALLVQGRTAMAKNDDARLRSVLQQLVPYLPEEKQTYVDPGGRLGKVK